jgi:hypothetical protein
MRDLMDQVILKVKLEERGQRGPQVPQHPDCYKKKKKKR